MAAKMAKLPQTDWTRGGRDISNTSIPLYQSGLNRLGDYTADPQQFIDAYMNKYYGANAIQNQDFLRAYNRAQGNLTGNNYATTQGGFTTSAQKAYDDQQKYYNDLASRLQQYGVNSSRNMYDQDVINQMNALNQYNNAYRLGQTYSQVEQQNALADQANRNWLGNAIQLGGTALGSLVGAPQIGAALGGAIGSGFQTDTSQAMAAIYGGNPSNYATAGTGQFINPYQGLNDVDWAGQLGNVKNWWNSARNKDTLSGKIGFQQPATYTVADMANASGMGRKNYWSLGG